MICTRVKVGTTTAIVCHGGRRPRACACGQPSSLLCDWIIGKRAGKPLRCSAPICAGCAHHVGQDKHLCPAHGEAWAADPRNPSNKAPTASP